MTYDEFKQNFLPEFLNINSYAGRMRYADERLPRIGSGTGRRVYDIDGEKVLKLAMNAKGVAQNGAEAGAGYYRDTQHIVTEVFDSADDDTWLIAEKAKKVTKKRIEELTEIPNLDILGYFLINYEVQSKGQNKRFEENYITREEEEFLYENEFAQDLSNFIANYGQNAGDMGRPSSYGEVLRDGQPAIVLTDYGLNDEVYDTHYSPDRKKRNRYQMYELYNYADGNDDILSDAGGGQDIRTGMWAQMPYSVSDGGDNSNAVINEGFVNLVSKRDKYPNKSVEGISVLADSFHECVNNIRETLNHVDNKEQFYGNLLKLQEYLIRRGFYNRDPLLSESYVINEDIPAVDPDTLTDRNYADELAREIANKLSLTQPKYIGGGANGFAYQINDNLVMKLTTDVSEADAASKLLRVRPQNIATIFNLYKVLDTATNKSIFVIMQENVNEKPLEKFRKFDDDIEKIQPAGMGYTDILSSIRIPKRFDYNQMLEIAKHVLTDNPAANVSQTDRQAAYEFLVGILNIRKELLGYGIKSKDYVEKRNLGYKDGVLKFFDTGGYYGVDEPNIGDDDVIQLPENITEEQLEEDYPRDKADRIANRITTKLGIQEPKYLGHGTIGVAYDIGDNKVLKITKDNSEAYENLKLVGKKLKYIADVYRVFEVTPENIPEGEWKTYAIILEKLVPDEANFKRMYERLDYVFKNIFDTDYKEALDSYLDGHQYNDDAIDKSKVDNYFKKNSQDGEFFFSILRIVEELREHGIDSYDFYNPENLGYKPSGVIGFFDVGFTDFFMQPHGAEKMGVEVDEDGSAKFSTDSDVGQDGFPPYNTNDTSPSINNDLDANVAMYEDLEYNHVKGDATDDEYMLGEDFGSDIKTTNLGKNLYKKIKENINNIKFESIELEFNTTNGERMFSGVGFNINQISIIDLQIAFFPLMKNNRAFFDPKTKTLCFFILEKRQSFSDEPPKQNVESDIHFARIRFASWVNEDTFVHEFVHYLDDTKYSDTYKSSNDSYYNRDEEYNAYYLEGLKNIHANKKRYEKYSDFNVFISKLFQDSIEHNKPFNGEFIRNLNADNKKKLTRRLYTYYDNKINGDNALIERDKSFGTGSKTVKVKRKCQLAGLGNTSVACNQGDINNLEFGSVNEDDLEVSEYFSSLVPDMNENIMSLQDLPFKEEVEQLGGKIFSVGGAVRDEFLGKESKDLDILVTGIPMDKLGTLMSKYGKVDAVGKQFGVLKFKPQGASEEIDVAIPRTEKATGEGGHKGFDVSSDHELPLEKDLERRDFTINAIAKDIDGNIIDPFGGQEDLKNKIIRIVNPEAFSDDPLRMLRAVQFAARFGFKIDDETREMIKKNAGRIKEIPPERILIEFDKIVKKGNAFEGAYLLKDLGLTPQIFNGDGGLYMGKEWNVVKTMGEFLWLTAHHLVQDIAEYCKSKLKCDIDTYKELKAFQQAFQADDNIDNVTARTLAHNIFKILPNTLNSEILPEPIKRAAQELLTGKYPKDFGELAIDGNVLMSMGLQGREIGDMLKSLLIKVYSDNVRNDREELLSLVREKDKEIQEGYPNYDGIQPKTWNVNGKQVTIDFFVKEYDKWNNQGGKDSGYHDASHESVLEFLQNNYEDFSVDEKLRKELYWALTDRNLLGEEEVKRVSYSAVVLDDKSRASLLKVLSPMIPEGWEVVAHHMTIMMGALENGSDAQEDMEKNIEISLRVIDYAMDELVMAVGVEGYHSNNPKPHITIAVNRADGGKPFMSNKLKDWKPLGFPLNLTGKVSEE